MKNWVISENLSKIPKTENGYGCCYAIKIPVIQGVCLIKIGATIEPKVRLQNFRKKGTIFCISPPHLNYWENKEILHNHYKQYRIPSRPHKGVQAELFNISLVYLFQTMPDLVYETKK